MLPTARNRNGKKKISTHHHWSQVCGLPTSYLYLQSEYNILPKLTGIVMFDLEQKQRYYKNKWLVLWESAIPSPAFRKPILVVTSHTDFTVYSLALHVHDASQWAWWEGRVKVHSFTENVSMDVSVLVSHGQTCYAPGFLGKMLIHSTTVSYVEHYVVYLPFISRTLFWLDQWLNRC